MGEPDTLGYPAPRRKDTKPPRSVRAAATSPPKPKRRQRLLSNDRNTSNITEIRGNLLVTRSGELWAYYVLQNLPWAFQSVGYRNTVMSEITQRFTELVGHRIHIRTTAQPFPHGEWARGLRDANPRILPDTPVGEPFRGTHGFLANAQRVILGARAYQHTTYVGVRVLTNTPSGHRECVLAREPHEREPEWAVQAINQIHRIDEVMRRPGFRARPVSARALVWLVHASLGMGIPVSRASLEGPRDVWANGDVDSFAEVADVTQEPFDRHVTVTGDRDGQTHTRYTSILTVGRMGDREDSDPRVWPWMAYTQSLLDAEGLPVPVEWSAHLDVFDGRAKEFTANRMVQIAEDQEHHYVDHGMSVPESVKRAVGAAKAVADRRTSGMIDQRVTLRGQVRVAVTGDTPSAVTDRVSDLIQEYASAQYSTELIRIGAQFSAYREFTPGSGPEVTAGHIREMSGWFAATSVPHATASLGDSHGPLFGFTAGYGRRPVFFDPNTGPERNQSGVGCLLGPQGVGKSFASGVLADWVTRLGRQVVMYDPAGTGAELTRQPHLHGHSREINLSGAAPGTLNPYRLVPDPRPDDHPDLSDYRAAVADAELERAQLAMNCLVSLLSNPRPEYVSAIEAAVAATPKMQGTSLWDVLEALTRDGKSGAEAAQQLRSAASLRGGSLMFPPPTGSDVAHHESLDAGLTVITMRDLEIPTGTAMDQRERVAHAVLRLAARLAQLAMYTSREPKLIVSDEMGQIGGGNALSMALNRWAMDSRKWNTAVLLNGQNPSHVLGLAPEVSNLFGWGLIGRMESLEAAKAGLDILGVPQGHGYEQQVMHLHTGRFLMRDFDRVIDILDVVSVSQVTADALNTTPPGRVVTPDELSPGDPFAGDLMLRQRVTA